MKTKLALLVCALAAVIFAACGGGSGSCTFSSGNFSICEEFSGSAWTSTTIMSSCTAQGTGSGAGMYSSGACPTGGNGTCVVGKGTATEYKYTFPGAADAGAGFSYSQFCTSAGGTFTP
jgi:hypothetical protein